MIDFGKLNMTMEEDALALKIAQRAHRASLEAGRDIQLLHFFMDICVCHALGCPLKLEGLLAADNFNFAHDVFGIYKHLNRETGQLTGGFLPRYADLDKGAEVANG